MSTYCHGAVLLQLLPDSRSVACLPSACKSCSEATPFCSRVLAFRFHRYTYSSCQQDSASRCPPASSRSTGLLRPARQTTESSTDGIEGPSQFQSCYVFCSLLRPSLPILATSQLSGHLLVKLLRGPPLLLVDFVPSTVERRFTRRLYIASLSL